MCVGGGGGGGLSTVAEADGELHTTSTNLRLKLVTQNAEKASHEHCCNSVNL